MQEAEPLPWFYTCSAILHLRLTRLLMCLHILLYRGYSCASFARPRLPINVFSARAHEILRRRNSRVVEAMDHRQDESMSRFSIPWR
ncbi:hypothetical protein M758_7G093700 [Ceratodon purpureus]|nr:hypothetical protein M758_7G093700 [Ceratodon purpureus]